MHRHNFLLFFHLLFSLTLHAGWFGKELTPLEKIPKAQQFMVHQDRQYNERSLMFVKPVEVVPIYSAEIDLNSDTKANVGLSDFITDDMKRFLFGERNNKRFVRIFSTSPIPLQEGVRKGPEYLGSKLTSHSTHLVWDPKNPKSKNYYIKLTDASVINPADARKSVAMSDFLERQKLDPATEGSILPERAATYSIVGGRQYSNILREVEPPGLEKKPNEVLLPAHALLDWRNPLRRTWNEQQKGDWNSNQFFPKFGYWLGKLNLGKGIYPESHSQNTLVRVNEKTGEIYGFVFRDMHDTAIDPMIRNLRNLSGAPPELLDLSILNLQHVDLTKPNPKESVPPTGTEILNSYSLYFVNKSGCLPEFIEGYRKAAKEILPELNEFEGIKENWHALAEKYPTLTFENIYNQMTSGLTRKALTHNEWKELEKSDGLIYLFKSRLKANHIGMANFSPYEERLDLATKEGLRFFSEGKHILVVNSEQKPVSVLPDLLPWELTRAGVKVSKPGNSDRCGLGKI